jgi:meiotically up-regulated gene 157 (Mug157) protein
VNPAPINDTIACVQAYIDTFQKDLDPKIFAVFKKAFPNTLETTVQHYDLTKDN